MPAPTALLLHGFLLNARLWDDVIAGLPDGARVVAPDLRGHGGAPVSRAVSVPEIAAAIASL